MNPFFWPNEIEILLLRSAIDRNPHIALDSFEKWTKHQGFTPALLNKGQVLPQVYDSLEEGSKKLLPMVYSNFQRLEIEHPIADQFVSYHRYTTYRNRMLRSEADLVFEHLKTLGIPYYVRKGLAYLSLYYEDYGARPTSDIDIVVDRDNVHLLLEYEEARGWKSVIDWRLNSIHDSLIHAITLKKQHFEMDLHWRFSHFPLSNKWNRKILEKGIDYDGMLVLPHEYNLMDTLIHGYLYNHVRPIRWVCDATRILERHTPDWQQIIDFSDECQVSIPLYSGLEFLSRKKLAEIPESVLVKLASVKTKSSISNYFKLMSNDRHFDGLKVVLFNSQGTSESVTDAVSKIIKHYRLTWRQKSIAKVFAIGFFIAFEKLFFKNRIIFFKKVRNT